MTIIPAQSVRGVRTDDNGTMAYETARTRWPVTVQKMVEDCERSADETAQSDAAQAEMKELSNKLRDLKASIERDAKLS
jgi:hypothetical protein